MVTVNDVSTLLENENISPANARKLQSILSDTAKTRVLKMELAATVDCMELFVRATYNLGSDGFLTLEVYERIRALNML